MTAGRRSRTIPHAPDQAVAGDAAGPAAAGRPVTARLRDPHRDVGGLQGRTTPARSSRTESRFTASFSRAANTATAGQRRSGPG